MTNELVFIQENKVVTDSLMVAEAFEKDHKNVLRDITIQIEYAGEKFSQLNFEQSTYINERGREYPKYNLTEEAFALVVFSYNTKEAVQTKIKFIQEFKRMKEFIGNKQPTQKITKKKPPNLASANNTVKILGTLMEKAGIDADIQLLTAKTVYAQAGIDIPLLIEADQKYYDTTYIAKKVGMSVKKSGKPAVTAVSQLIKSLPLEESETKDFFEGKDNWQGSVTKYSESVIEKVRNWLVENGYPMIIEGESKNYHVVYDTYDVA